MEPRARRLHAHGQRVDAQDDSARPDLLDVRRRINDQEDVITAIDARGMDSGDGNATECAESPLLAISTRHLEDLERPVLRMECREA